MKAPFPWFGGKRRVAPLVWQAFGDVANYCEPFFGSGAVLLGRPTEPGIETVNDKDGFVSNFWRSVKADPEAVAHHADWPVMENDLHARHAWLVTQRASLQSRLEGDPDFFDVKIAGWWVWGMACWIGSGFCSGEGPWVQMDGKLVNVRGTGQGVARQLVHLGDSGRGVARQLVHLGSAGRGVARQLVHLGNAGQGNAGDGERGLLAWMQALSIRLARVRVCSGDWSRILGPTPTFTRGLTGVFLDPPYSAEADRDEKIYAQEDLTVAHDVRGWCLANGSNPLLRTALCGYEGEHDELMDAGWRVVEWKAKGGYGAQGTGRGVDNAKRERIWFSPACLATTATEEAQAEMFS